MKTLKHLKADLDKLVAAKRLTAIKQLDRDIYLQMEIDFVKNWKKFYKFNLSHLSHKELKQKFGVAVALLLFHLDPDSFERVYDR